MQLLALLAFSVGLLGLLGATVLSPLLAWLVSDRSEARRSQPTRPQTLVHPSLQILVSAHNEAGTIQGTLESITKAATATTAGIIVGLDNCIDETAVIAQQFAMNSPLPVKLQIKQGAPGKWTMLIEMAGAAQAEWIALVDCGSRWDPALLRDTAIHMQHPQVQAIAPSYMPRNAGLLERWNWRLEQSIKTLEMRSGGPISVHGATVFYRRATLLAVLERLKGRVWLNDDLVIPSMIRLMSPVHQVIYLRSPDPARAYVIDQGLKPAVAVEYRRRRRMMHGSVEWLRLMLALHCSRQPVVALLVSRRVCRMLWGYWVICLLVAVTALAAPRLPELSLWQYSLPGLAALAAIAASNYVRRMTSAFLSALLTPFYLARSLASGGGAEPVAWQ